MHNFVFDERINAVLKKLRKKDRKIYDSVRKKIGDIVSTPDISHYKNLRKPKQHLKRVHVAKSFVLVFSYDSSEDIVHFLDYDHHDNIYKK